MVLFMPFLLEILVLITRQTVVHHYPLPLFRIFPPALATKECKVLADPTFANLDIAALCGFVNVFLWGANIWFLYKETRPGVVDGGADVPGGAGSGGGYEPYGPGSEPYGAGPGMGGSVGAGGQWGAGQSAVQGGMNEI